LLQTLAALLFQYIGIQAHQELFQPVRSLPRLTLQLELIHKVSLIGDIDGDGKPDIAVTNYGSSTVSVFRNTSTSGSITSSSLSTKVDFTTGSAPVSVVIGDIDGDGKPDLAVTSGSNVVAVLRNTSTSGSISAGSFAAKLTLPPELIHRVLLWRH